MGEIIFFSQELHHIMHLADLEHILGLSGGQFIMTEFEMLFFLIFPCLFLL